MQRLHEQDVSGVIVSKNLGYDHLMLPMEFEAARRCRTSIGFVDPRKEDGELLFPARFPRHVVDRDKAVLGEYAVAGQFQQRPAPRGGAIFKTTFFKRYDGAPPAMRWRAIFADTAMKAKEENDYSVFEEWGLGVDGRPYLLDLVRGKWEAPELETVARAFWTKAYARPSNVWGTLRYMGIEDKVSGTGLIQKFQRERIPVQGIERDKDKVQRAHDVTPYLAVNPIMIAEDSPFADVYLAEMQSFPRAANDDQVDPTVDAVKALLAGGLNYNAWVT
jgi:predicted phage terminase large subunit-like protein